MIQPNGVSGSLDGVELELVDTTEKVEEFMRWLGTTHANNAIACDTETEGLDPYHGDRIRLIQFGDTEKGWAIPWEDWRGLALEVLRRWDGLLVFHHSKFDVNYLMHTAGWVPDWSRIHDTMLLGHINNPNGVKGLKPLGGLYVDPRSATSQSVLDVEMNTNNWDWATVPIVRDGAGSSYWVYAALDVVLTSRLFDIFQPVRHEFARAYDIEMGIMPTIASMERLGTRVNPQYCEEKIGAITSFVDEARSWVKSTYGIENPNSTVQCVKAFQDLGREITSMTPKGAPKLDKEQLETFLAEEGQPGNDLAHMILEIRRGTKMRDTYFRNLIKFADSNDRVHPTIWTCGARTGRMSVSNPALQTLPRKDPSVRGAFIPDSDDHVLLMCDYDQIEMRLAAHFSQDDALRDAFVNQADFFSTVATNMWQTPIAKGDPRRQATKTTCYALLYGAGEATMATSAGVDRETMHRVLGAFHANYPGISRLQEQVTTVARQRTATEGTPYVNTLFGKKMRGDPGEERKLLNYLIQASAAEVLKSAICSLDAAGLRDYMRLPVHDEIVFSVPKADAEEIRQTVQDTMRQDGYFVPITCDADIEANNWGDKYRK